MLPMYTTKKLSKSWSEWITTTLKEEEEEGGGGKRVQVMCQNPLLPIWGGGGGDCKVEIVNRDVQPSAKNKK
jgi:hypothetical protein